MFSRTARFVRFVPQRRQLAQLGAQRLELARVDADAEQRARVTARDGTAHDGHL